MKLGSIAQYKVMILYMLSCVNFPMTKIQLTEFFVAKKYARVEEVQEALAALLDSKLIDMEETYNSSRYSIKPNGISTLSYFRNDLDNEIISDIDKYMQDNHIKLMDDAYNVSQIYQTSPDNYVVECKVLEGNDTLIKLEILVPDKDQAEKMSANWKKSSDEIFRYIMLKLFSNKK